MDTVLLLDILKQCRDMGLEQIIFSGGEPMYHKDFWEAIDKADWFGFKIRILSNLTLLNDKRLAELEAMHIHEVQTSLYSIESSIHDSITTMPGSCEKTKNAVVKLVEHGIPAFISCPVMKQNKNSYPDVLAWARGLGIRSAPNNMIVARTDGSTGNLRNRLSLDEALQVIQDILSNDTAYDAECFLPGYDNPDTALPCAQNVCANSVCVNAQGYVLPSPDWHRVLGNLHTQTLRDIWENSPELECVRNISLDDFPQCRDCPDIQFCCMSPEGNANESPKGDPFTIPIYICALARSMRELVHGWHKAKEAV
jgi:radical SAM protein with 4Fe4S-binding SPASM domain